MNHCRLFGIFLPYPWIPQTNCLHNHLLQLPSHQMLDPNLSSSATTFSLQVSGTVLVSSSTPLWSFNCHLMGGITNHCHFHALELIPSPAMLRWIHVLSHAFGHGRSAWSQEFLKMILCRSFCHFLLPTNHTLRF